MVFYFHDVSFFVLVPDSPALECSEKFEKRYAWSPKARLDLLLNNHSFQRHREGWVLCVIERKKSRHYKHRPERISFSHTQKAKENVALGAKLNNFLKETTLLFVWVFR